MFIVFILHNIIQNDENFIDFNNETLKSQNLKLEVKISDRAKKRVDVFQQTIWDLRRLIFALCVSEFVLHSPTATEKHLQRFKMLMHQAKANFIYKEDIYG